MSEQLGKFSFQNRLIILISTCAFCGIAVWMVMPAPPIGFYWDDTWYLLMAEYISGHIDHQRLAWVMLQLRQYPPLFPFALSLTGEVLGDQQNAFIMNAVFLALGTGVAMVWFIRERFPTKAAVLAAFVLMFNPVALYWLPILFSEPLFILLTTLALALASFRSEKLFHWLGIGVIVGLSVATRSAGWPLAMGMLIFLVVDQKLKLTIGFILGLVAGLLCILFFKSGFPPSRSYQESIVQTIKSLDWEYLTQQFRAILAGWRLLWGSLVGAVLAAVFVIPGFTLRLIKNRPDAWYIMVYLFMLVVWPFPDHMSRFLWPLLPAFLVSAYSAMGLFRLEKHSSITISLALICIFAFSVPNGIGISLERLINPPPSEFHDLSRMMEWTRSEDRMIGLDTLKTRRQFLNDMQHINNLVAGDDCVYSEFSMMVTTHTHRVALASPWNNLGEVGSLKLKCQYYYLIPSALPNTTVTDVERFGTIHKELFRSQAPYDPEGNELLGVFFHLHLPASQQLID